MSLDLKAPGRRNPRDSLRLRGSTLTRGSTAALHGRHGQRDQSVFAGASTLPCIPGRPYEQGEDVPEVRHNGSMVSWLRPESPLGRVGDVPRVRRIDLTVRTSVSLDSRAWPLLPA